MEEEHRKHEYSTENIIIDAEIQNFRMQEKEKYQEDTEMEQGHEKPTLEENTIE